MIPDNRLPVLPQVRRDRASFVVFPSNARALDIIDMWPAWPTACALIVGPTGSGKTHLAGIWARRSAPLRLAVDRSSALRAPDDDTPDISGTPDISDIPALATRQLVIDDVHRLRAPRDLLHLLNALRQHGGSVLLTSAVPVEVWGNEPADLRSRLQAALHTTLAPPEDGLLRAIMVKSARDLGMTPADSLIDYLMPRIPRTPGAAVRVIRLLDRYALEWRMGAGVPLARRILPLLADEEPQ